MKRNEYCVLLSALLIVTSASSIAYAQPARPGGGGPFNSSLYLLRSESVREELDLVPEQEEKLREIGARMREKMREEFAGLRDLSAEERRERYGEIREKMAEIQEEMQDEVNGILLPQQRDRLAQIRFQMQTRRGGAGGLTSQPVVEALGITDEQLEKVRQKEQEVREELAEKIRQAQQEARSEILSVLTPEQRKKYEELTGEPFELRRQAFGQGGFQRGRANRGPRGGRPGADN